MTKAINALGVVLTFDTDIIGEIQSFGGTRTRRMIEILSCDSTNDAVEKIAGALNEGEVTFHCIYDGGEEGVYKVLDDYYHEGTEKTVLITYPNTGQHKCTGLISSLSWPSFSEADGEVSIDVTIAFSGKAAFTDAGG